MTIGDGFHAEPVSTPIGSVTHVPVSELELDGHHQRGREARARAKKRRVGSAWPTHTGADVALEPAGRRAGRRAASRRR